ILLMVLCRTHRGQKQNIINTPVTVGLHPCCGGFCFCKGGVIWMKIDKDFKHEVDTEVSEGWYVARKILVKGVIVVVIATVFFGGISFASKMAATNADRVIFKQSVTYN